MKQDLDQRLETAQEQSAQNERRRREVVERMWLNYFNNGLLEKGIITPEQHRKMKVYITTRKPPTMEG